VIDEYVFAAAAIAVFVLGWVWVKRWGPARGGRPLVSGAWAILLLLVLGFIVGAGGIAIADLVASALGISVLWLVALEAAAALGLRLRSKRRSAHS